MSYQSGPPPRHSESLYLILEETEEAPVRGRILGRGTSGQEVSRGLQTCRLWVIRDPLSASVSRSDTRPVKITTTSITGTGDRNKRISDVNSSLEAFSITEMARYLLNPERLSFLFFMVGKQSDSLKIPFL